MRLQCYLSLFLRVWPGGLGSCVAEGWAHGTVGSWHRDIVFSFMSPFLRP